MSDLHDKILTKIPWPYGPEFIFILFFQENAVDCNLYPHGFMASILLTEPALQVHDLNEHMTLWKRELVRFIGPSLWILLLFLWPSSPVSTHSQHYMQVCKQMDEFKSVWLFSTLKWELPCQVNWTKDTWSENISKSLH